MITFFTELFGQGKDLNTLQMCSRGVASFIIALVLIRISGRRSFGLRTPLDNIVAILLGAILSRGVVGANPFLPVIVTCFAVVLMHRLFGWLVSRSEKFSRVTEGDKILLFEKGKFNDANAKKALVCREDIMQGIRKSAMTDDLDQVDKAYMERNGEISAILKERA